MCYGNVILPLDNPMFSSIIEYALSECKLSYYGQVMIDGLVYDYLDLAVQENNIGGML